MAKANKTVETEASVEDFLARVDVPQRAADAHLLIDLMARISGEPPRLWGPSIIGFGSVHYRYESGREGDTPAIAFSPRKAELVLYVGASTPNIAALLPGLGKHRTGKGCLYLKRLADADAGVLEAVVRTAWGNRLASAVA
ncbi:MAG: DUF1801 domain-containing protein [Sphingomonas sp.]|nr:DUF1801 domain-containing protein [Sphingomonas sp.]